jgi:hypothetical protein
MNLADIRAPPPADKMARSRGSHNHSICEAQFDALCIPPAPTLRAGEED